MGGNYGGRGGRGGSTSRHEGIENSKENSKEKKENKPSGVKISAEEIRGMVGKFLRDLSGNTNPKKVPRLLNRLSEETIRALSFMRTLKYVTDKELIAKYIAAEEKREEWFTSESWPFTADVKPDELPLLTYGTVARCYGKTVYPSETDDAFFEFINTPEGMLRTAEYDKMLCVRLTEAFGKRTINSTIRKYEAVTLHVHSTDEILDDVITFVGTVSTIDHDLGELDEDEVEQVIEVLNRVLSKSAPELGVGMTTATKGKGYSVAWWCELLVDKATLRMEATDEFDAWQKKSKGHQPMSEADRLELINSRKKIAQLEKEIAQLKASKQNGPWIDERCGGRQPRLLQVWGGRAPRGPLPIQQAHKPCYAKAGQCKASWAVRQEGQFHSAGVRLGCGSGFQGCCAGGGEGDGEAGRAPVTVRPGDAVLRMEAGHFGFCCISGQQWCDRHPQLVRSVGSYRRRLGVPALRACGLAEASKTKVQGAEMYRLRLFCLLCSRYLFVGLFPWAER